MDSIKPSNIGEKNNQMSLWFRAFYLKNGFHALKSARLSPFLHISFVLLFFLLFYSDSWAQKNGFEIASLAPNDNFSKFEKVMRDRRCTVILSSFFSKSLPGGQPWHYLAGAECAPSITVVAEDFVALQSSPMTGNTLYMIGHAVSYESNKAPSLETLVGDLSKKYGTPDGRVFDKNQDETILFWRQDKSEHSDAFMMHCISDVNYFSDAKYNFKAECGAFFVVRTKVTKDETQFGVAIRMRVVSTLVDARLASTLAAKDKEFGM